MQKIAINEKGYRVGQSHQNAVLTDHEVELIRRLHADGETYATLAEKFDTTRRTIAAICRFERRGQTIRSYKVHVSTEPSGLIQNYEPKTVDA